MKDEEVVDVMQMELESDTEDLSGKTIEHVEEVLFIVGVYLSGSTTNSLNTPE